MRVLTLKEYIYKFLTYLEIEKNRSLATVRNYEFYLTRFASWAHERGIDHPCIIDLENITQYRLWLNRFGRGEGAYNHAPLKKSTQNYHLIALRAFFKYLSKIDVEVLAPEKIELGKMPERDISFIEGSELERFLNAPIASISKQEDVFRVNQRNNPRIVRGAADYRNTMESKVDFKQDSAFLPNLIALRDKAILETSFSTGLRVSELVSLKIEQVDLKDPPASAFCPRRQGADGRAGMSSAQELTVRGKGSKARIVFLSNQALHWIKKYLAVRNDVSPYIFTNHDKGSSKRDKVLEPLTPRSVQRIVKKYAKLAGITKKVSPHTLRHSFAANLLANEADIRSVQIMLGHSSITTTQIYTHITDKHLRETFVKHHKRGGK